jgi:hypothetical protein
VDREGAVRIELRYEGARDFSEGLAAVRDGGLWGYVDTDGRMTIPARFEQAGSFRGPLAAVHLEGRPAWIDREGRIVWTTDAR